MFDYQTSKHAHFDAACRAFALSHNLEDVAAAVGMRPQILRNKLNPIQPHRLTCDELLAITDYTEDARLLDGMLGQINCLPSVPVNNATEANMQFCALNATANVGAIAGEHRILAVHEHAHVKHVERGGVVAVAQLLDVGQIEASCNSSARKCRSASPRRGTG
ncbi:phage regulatory CII family protein [Pseudomonas aeruginosa]|nr:phage regulatory CII family protein [Pseudomonas aeruginosa]